MSEAPSSQGTGMNKSRVPGHPGDYTCAVAHNIFGFSVWKMRRLEFWGG